MPIRHNQDEQLRNYLNALLQSSNNSNSHHGVRCGGKLPFPGGCQIPGGKLRRLDEVLPPAPMASSVGRVIRMEPTASKGETLGPMEGLPPNPPPLKEGLWDCPRPCEPAPGGDGLRGRLRLGGGPFPFSSSPFLPLAW